MSPEFDYLVECQRYYERELAKRDEELRELIQQWRDSADAVEKGGTRTDRDIAYRYNKCADELEELLDER